LFPAGKGAVDYPPHLAPKLKKEYSYTYNPLQEIYGVLEGEP